MRYIFHIILVLLASCRTSGDSSETLATHVSNKPKLHLSDVSVLFPDSIVDFGENLLFPSSAGRGGALLPDSVFQTSDDKPFTVMTLEGIREIPHVVSFRIDPCFPRLEYLKKDPAKCIPQMRLIFSNSLLQAIHATYRLSAGDLRSVVRELAELGDHSEEAMKKPLGVHPVMLREGLNGVTATSMRKIILRYAGSENLIGVARIKFSSPPFMQWHFEVAFLIDGKLVLQPIPGLKEETKFEVFNNRKFPRFSVPRPGRDMKDFGMVSSDTNQLFQDLAVLMDKSELQKAKDREIVTALNLLPKIDNPELTHFDDSRCTTCHISTPSAAGAFQIRGIQANDGPDMFKSTYNLDLVTKSDEDRMFQEFRNFSSSHAISQRVINESAAVVDALIQQGVFP